MARGERDSDLLTLRHPELPWTAATPVHFDDAAQAWIVCSHADVESVLFRSDDFNWDIWDRRLDPIFAGMWAADGRRHADLRRLTQRCFQPRRLRAMSSEIERIATDLVDDVLAAGTGAVDVVNDFSYPLGGRLICGLFGVDPADVNRMIGWRKQQHAAINEGRSPALPEMWAYFEELIARRRCQPQDAVLDHLIAAQRDGYQVDGAPLNDWDLIGSVWILVSSGLTGAKLGHTLVNLAEHGLLDRARSDADLLAGAAEETLRLYPSLPVVRLRARRDVEVGGTVIPRDELVHACIFTANLDPARFPDPDRFDPGRTPNRHLAFGVGLHHCLGAQLVRIEVVTALRIILERLPNLRLDPDTPVEHAYGRILGTVFQARFLFDYPPAAGAG